MEMHTTTENSECRHPYRAQTTVELIPDGTKTESNGPGLSVTIEMVRIVALCNECGAEVVRRDTRGQAEHEIRCQAWRNRPSVL